MSKNDELDIIKRPHTKTAFDLKGLEDLAGCVADPLFFMENFMKIQHPLRGAVPFQPYPYQRDLIRTFHDNRFAIALTARQMGKSSTYNTIILANGKPTKIGSLVKLIWKQRLINWLEGCLLKIATNN